MLYDFVLQSRKKARSLDIVSMVFESFLIEMAQAVALGTTIRIPRFTSSPSSIIPSAFPITHHTSPSTPPPQNH